MDEDVAMPEPCVPFLERRTSTASRIMTIPKSIQERLPFGVGTAVARCFMEMDLELGRSLVTL